MYVLRVLAPCWRKGKTWFDLERKVESFIRGKWVNAAKGERAVRVIAAKYMDRQILIHC